jgi:hypothetical protein
LLSPKEFNRAQKGDGIGFKTTELGKMMRIPSRKEAQHFQIMGDTGVGKTQLIVQMLCQIQERGESAIVYDPACEYLQRFYDKGRGDIVLNPLDERCPYWGPANEMASNAEADAIAASLYQPATDAKDEFDIRRNQLDLGTLAHIDAPGDPDMVLAQTPPPNAGVDQPRVNILLSSSNGAASSAFVMPSFIGMSVGSAYRTANALGLRIAILGEAPAESPVSPQSSPAPPAGPIAAQAPESGFRVTRGDTIHLTVAHAQPDATTATPQAPLPPPQ